MLFKENEKIEEALYEQVAQEINSNKINQGLWLKATVDSGGNDFKAKALYTKYRVNQLKYDLEEAYRLQLEAYELQLRVQAQKEARLRQKIISLRVEGFSYYLIAQDFNEQKIPISERYSNFESWSAELVKLIDS